MIVILKSGRESPYFCHLINVCHCLLVCQRYKLSIVTASTDYALYNGTPLARRSSKNSQCASCSNCCSKRTWETLVTLLTERGQITGWRQQHHWNFREKEESPNHFDGVITTWTALRETVGISKRGRAASVTQNSEVLWALHRKSSCM
jgi:hypothetical protein